MAINISVHVDGYYGLRYGVGDMLDLFDKYKIKACFFINMGGEAGLFKILKYRTKGLKKSDKSIGQRYTKMQIIRMLLMPKMLGNANCKILNEIKSRGHEVNPHCWSHLLWSKNFKKIDIPNEFSKMCNSFENCVYETPRGFAPPTWKWDARVLNEMKKHKMEYLSVDKGGKPYFKNGILIIPLTFNRTPEELLNKGLNKKQVIEVYKKHIKNRGYVNLYFHADYEGIFGLDILESILKLLKGKKTNTFEEILLKNKLNSNKK